MAEYICREAILDDLEKEIEAGNVALDEDVWINKGLRIAIRDIKDIKVADVQPIDRWINAKTNPPPIADKRSKTSSSVLILRENGSYDVAFYCYDDEGNYWTSDDEKTMYEWDEVTRWQPLPKPPKDGDTE